LLSFTRNLRRYAVGSDGAALSFRHFNVGHPVVIYG
jgi:hypothetical protein